MNAEHRKVLKDIEVLLRNLKRVMAREGRMTMQRQIHAHQKRLMKLLEENPLPEPPNGRNSHKAADKKKPPRSAAAQRLLSEVD